MACTTISATGGVLSLNIGASAHHAQKSDSPTRPSSSEKLPTHRQMPFPQKCLAFEGEFPLFATCLGRELSLFLQCNLVAWCATCGWSWGSHSAPRVAKRTAGRARMEWSPRIGAHPQSCRSSSVTRTPGCQSVCPRFSGPVAANLQAPTPGRPLALLRPGSTPWFSLDAT